MSGQVFRRCAAPQIHAEHPVFIMCKNKSLEDSVTRNCSGVCLLLDALPCVCGVIRNSR